MEKTQAGQWVCAKSPTTHLGPFGEVIRKTGPACETNPFRFSTKYQDNESDLLYYGYRYYNASTERWLSRDPIEEKGGINLYCFIGNDASDKADYFGLLAMDSVTALIEACLRQPTVPAQIECLQNLLDTVVSDSGRNLVKNALNTLTSKMKRCASIYASYKVACGAPGCAEDGLSMAEYIKRASKASLCATLRALWLRQCACKGFMNGTATPEFWQSHWLEVGKAAAKAMNCWHKAKAAGYGGDIPPLDL